MVKRALVLSGGGAVGIAWQTGLAAGLASEGVDLRQADFVLGTSAGSAVGAQIALGRDMAAAMARFTPRPDADRQRAGAATASGADRAAPERSPRQRMRELFRSMASGAGADPKAARAAVGRVALEADTIAEADFVRGFEYLAGAAWPPHFHCTAVDAESGRFKLWDASAGVALHAAVASSCAVPGMFPPITLNGRRYMDGGTRTGTNADMARDRGERVLIVTLRSATPGAAGSDIPGMRAVLDRELGILRDAGARVELVSPDEESAAVMGMDLMNPRLTPAAAQAGLRQGKAIAERLRDFWNA